MDSNTIFEVITELTGPIDPVADTAIDAIRMDNACTFLQVFNRMYERMEEIAKEHRDSPFHSQKEIGQMYDNYIKSLSNI